MIIVKVKKTMLFVLAMLFVLMSLFGCGKKAEKTLVNDVKAVFAGIEETPLTEYLETVPLTEVSSTAYLKNNNITVDVVKEKLVLSQDVIPFKGETGGTPYILMESIELVGDQWIYCNAEDGHVFVDLLVKFVVSENGEIEFKTCAMDMNSSGTYILDEGEVQDTSSSVTLNSSAIAERQP